jgi:bifunctional ADP-heptose synthase (sugar kinase/adenylyltransferase)
MDTREKIVDLVRAVEIAAGLRRECVGVTMVAAYFDVLTSDHVRRMEALANGRPLMLAVLDPVHPLLPARARAELAAALSVIDYVLLLDGTDLTRALEQIQPADVIRQEVADSERSQALIEHVHRRQRA